MSGAGVERTFSEHLPKIRSMGMMLFDPVWAQRMHLSNGCEMLHIIKGNVNLIMENCFFTAGPGETLLVPSNTSHQDKFDPNEGLEVFYCSFSWQKEADFFVHVDNNVLSGMSPLVKAELATMFDHLRADLTGSSEADRLVARVRLLTILLIILREATTGGRNASGAGEEESVSKLRRQDLMRQAKAYMEKHCAECITLDAIASALDVSPYHLSHVFSEESEFSLFSYLTNMRIDKARALLLEGKLNVSEVAYAIGYESPNYFSKVFNKHCGCPPRDYAARVRASKSQ